MARAYYSSVQVTEYGPGTRSPMGSQSDGIGFRCYDLPFVLLQQRLALE